MAKGANEAQLKGEGRLTKQLLRQKLQRGKGPLVNIGAGLSLASRDPEEIRRGVR